MHLQTKCWLRLWFVAISSQSCEGRDRHQIYFEDRPIISASNMAFRLLIGYVCFYDNDDDDDDVQ